MMEFRENVRGDVMDEIALEGLEGITISGTFLTGISYFFL